MSPQIKRLVLLALGVVTIFLVVRHLVVPKSFGKFGHYRADSIAENEERPLNYASSDSCQLCHPDMATEVNGGAHAPINCQICHGPAEKHIADPIAVKPLRPKDTIFCVRCHRQDPAKPASFPQIDPKKHDPVGDCKACHKPHHPKIGL